MSRWKWFFPIGLIFAVVAFNGVRLGMERASVTESAVIEFYSARYLEDHTRLIGDGAALTDCVAVPGVRPGVWIEVRCTPPDGSEAFIYGAARSGAQLYAGRDGEAPEA